MISGMMTNAPDEARLLRSAIAAAAARLIAQDGADYQSAKRKAAHQILGAAGASADAAVLPDNAMIEHEVRLYQALYLGDSQPARLLQLRRVALQVMEALAAYQPYLTGAVLSGSAGAHDDIDLHLFADSAKEVEIFLLNKNIQFDLSETPHFRGPRHDPVETVSFLWNKEGVHATIYGRDDLRGARKTRADGSTARLDSAGLRALLRETPHAPDNESTPVP